MLGTLVVFASSAAAQLQFAELSKRHLPADKDSTGAVALGDVNGDGDVDLVVGNLAYSYNFQIYGQQNRLYLNDGAGVFTDVTGSHMPTDTDQTRAVVLADVDGDGDLDMVLGNSAEHGGQQNRLYFNDGTGIFTDVTASRLPVANDRTFAVALDDVDGDRDLDVLVGNAGQNRLYLNVGTGTFIDATATHLPIVNDSTWAVALGDVDSDGDLDAVFGNAGQNRLCLNDGTGVFSDATAGRMPVAGDSTAAVALGDVDGDGDLDVVFGNQQMQNRLYLSDGTGTLADATAPRIPTGKGGTLAMALGDVDRDGDLDVVAGSYGNSRINRQNRLYLNDGTGTFDDATVARLPIDDDLTWATAMGDVDKDGDSDLVFATFRGQNRLYLNDGTGTFTDATVRLPTDGGESTAVALGDVDGDGDPDLAWGSSGSFARQQNRLYLNDGTGTFTDVTVPRMPVDSDQTRAAALGDVDGDGDLDLVFGNDQQNRLYLNDGTGTFADATAARLPTDGDLTWSVAMGDLDADGDPDLVLGNNGQNRLYLNDGTGTFTDATAARLPSDTDSTLSVTLGDVDSDGDLDLLLGNGGGIPSASANRIYLNDGAATFADATAALIPNDSDMTSAVALGDVDGDGDPDLLLGSGFNRLYSNLRRQLHVPFLVVPGRQYRLDVYSRSGPPRLVDVALPFVSTKTARIPLPPYGTIGLDPALMIALPPFVIPQPAGVGSVTATIPNDPSLIGRSIHAQAMLLHWPGPAYLTNVTTDRIVR